MKDKFKKIIERLELKQHPEGGYYKETYRSKGIIESYISNDINEGERSFSTCIYFLLNSEDFSAFHRMKQDEIWHFYDGSPLNVHMISGILSWLIKLNSLKNILNIKISLRL